MGAGEPGKRERESGSYIIEGTNTTKGNGKTKQ
jgi:hypothetical protein